MASLLRAHRITVTDGKLPTSAALEGTSEIDGMSVSPVGSSCMRGALQVDLFSQYSISEKVADVFNWSRTELGARR